MVAQGKSDSTHRHGWDNRVLQGSKAAEPVRGASAAGPAVQEPCPGSHGQVGNPRGNSRTCQPDAVWIILGMQGAYFGRVSVVRDAQELRFVCGPPLL